MEPDIDDQIQEATNHLNSLLLQAFTAGLVVSARVEPIQAPPIKSAPMVIVDVTEN